MQTQKISREHGTVGCMNRMKDFKGFKQLFTQAGEYCSLCYLACETNEEESRKNFQALANNSIADIINSCEDMEVKKIAEGSVSSCRNCNYGDPNIFHYLESNGIHF